MANRRERSIRELYEEGIMGRTLPAPYQRVVNPMDRRPPFRWSENDYDRETDVNYSLRGRRFQGIDHRTIHGGRGPYGGEKGSEPLYRREDPYVYNRGLTEEHPASRQDVFRSGSRENLQTRGHRPPPQPLLSLPIRGDITTHGTTNPDRRGKRGSQKRKSPHSPPRNHPPPKREEPSSSLACSSRSHSPEGNKNNPPQSSQPKATPILQEKDRPPSSYTAESGDRSPHSSVLATKEEVAGAGAEKLKEIEVKEDVVQTPEQRRAHVIANKALEIEKLYRQDCETFGMVVKMLVAKQPTLEKQLDTALKENLMEIKERCLDDLRQFISEVNVVLKSESKS